MIVPKRKLHKAGKEGSKATQKLVPKVTQIKPTTTAIAIENASSQDLTREAAIVVSNSPSDNAVIQDKTREVAVGVVDQDKTQDTSEVTRSDAPPLAPVWNIFPRGQKGKDVMGVKGHGVVTHNVDNARSSSFTITPG